MGLVTPVLRGLQEPTCRRWWGPAQSSSWRNAGLLAAAFPPPFLEAARWGPTGCLSFSLTFSQDWVSLQPYRLSREGAQQQITSRRGTGFTRLQLTLGSHKVSLIDWGRCQRLRGAGTPTRPLPIPAQAWNKGLRTHRQVRRLPRGASYLRRRRPRGCAAPDGT